MAKLYHGANFIGDFVPNDHSRQIPTGRLVEQLFEKPNDIKIVMDLGCGEGKSKDYFKRLNPHIKWIGVDIAGSPEVEKRLNSGPDFHTYDGVHIPFNENYFDLVYCRQVLEHVEKPYDLIKEVSRVIKPGGYFVGSTSYLEPFHSLSICNFTPYGFNLLLKDTSLKLIELRPGVDVFTLLLHRMFAKIKFIDRIFSSFVESKRQSPANFFITIIGKMAGMSNRDINLIKLLFCGQYKFLAKKE